MEEPWPALIRSQPLSPPAAPNFAERVSGRLSDGRGRAFVLAIRIFDVALPMVDFRRRYLDRRLLCSRDCRRLS
jgi:hypothetical protein